VQLQKKNPSPPKPFNTTLIRGPICEYMYHIVSGFNCGTEMKGKVVPTEETSLPINCAHSFKWDHLLFRREMIYLSGSPLATWI
jgi:hypothetical protein